MLNIFSHLIVVLVLWLIKLFSTTLMSFLKGQSFQLHLYVGGTVESVKVNEKAPGISMSTVVRSYCRIPSDHFYLRIHFLSHHSLDDYLLVIISFLYFPGTFT